MRTSFTDEVEYSAKLRERKVGREYGNGDAGLPLHDRHAGADTSALFVELDLAERIIF